MFRRCKPSLLAMVFAALAIPITALPLPATTQAGLPRPKRLGPQNVPPVTTDTVRIEVVHWGKERGLGQNGGYLEAFDRNSGNPLWLLQVYEIVYNPKLELDVQDRFIKQIAISTDHKFILVTDERGKRFAVRLADQQVAPCTDQHCPAVK